AAAAMLSKYWSAFLLVALALAALVHPKRREYFHSAAPWITAGVFVLIAAPHVWWLIANNFPPITWVTTRRIAASFGDTLGSMVEYLGGTLGYATVAIALVLIFVRPQPTAVANGLLPHDDRRTAAVLFWTPLLLPLVAALITGTSLLSLWSTPALNLLPVMLLGSPLVAVSRPAVLHIGGLITLLTLLVVAASPFVAYSLLNKGVENDAAYARLLMQAAE